MGRPSAVSTLTTNFVLINPVVSPLAWLDERSTERLSIGDGMAVIERPVPVYLDTSFMLSM